MPEQNLAVAVSSSGKDSHEQIIAQEIILEILREEGLIPAEETTSDPNTTRAPIPESLKQEYEGLYDFGQAYFVKITFAEDSLTLTPVGPGNLQTQEYLYNTDGKFLSTGGSYVYMGQLQQAANGISGATELTFYEDGYVMVDSHATAVGLGTTAAAMPVGERVPANPISSETPAAWEARCETEYLLMSEKYSSYLYLDSALTKLHLSPEVPGYVGMGQYVGAGILVNAARIQDENTAAAYRSTPTMTGRDTNNLYVTEENGVETLHVNGFPMIDAASISDASMIGGRVQPDGTAWYNTDDQASGQTLYINVPANSAWFTYDSKMNCVASFLAKNPQEKVILPEGGRIAFVGDEARCLKPDKDILRLYVRSTENHRVSTPCVLPALS